MAGTSARSRSTLAIGGVPINRQVRALARGVEVLVATPGRLLDLVNQRALRLDQVEVLVLDEADRMLDMGFIHDIKQIVAMLPKARQTLFFSATMPQEITRLADAMLRDPGPRRGHAASHNRRADRAARHPHRQGLEAVAAGRVAQDREDRSRAGLHPHQARRRQGRARPAKSRLTRPKRSTATSRRTSASACSPPSATASCAR